MRNKIAAFFSAAVIVILGATAAGASTPGGWAWNSMTRPVSTHAISHPRLLTSYGPYLFCGTSNQLCLDTHGVYNQLTVDTVNAGTANITLTKNGTYMGVTAYDLSDGSGNCIKTNNSNQIVVANGACVGSDQQEKWAWFGGTGSAQFQNASDGRFLGVDSWCSGCKVWNNASATNWQLVYNG